MLAMSSSGLRNLPIRHHRPSVAFLVRTRADGKAWVTGDEYRTS